jgi:hypothetical protein
MASEVAAVEKVDRPRIVEDGHLEFLDDLRETCTTNMFGAAPHLVAHFAVSRSDAKIILQYWMESFSERHPE